jgi:hypothetical protein
MTHSLCLDNCQVFGFMVQGDPSWSGYDRADVEITRYDVTKVSRTEPRGELTGLWVLPRNQARGMWADLIKKGAFHCSRLAFRA